jgi:hypothetical protein
MIKVPFPLYIRAVYVRSIKTNIKFVSEFYVVP